MALAALALYLAAMAIVAAAGLRDRLAPADVIVVFGNTVAADGQPSPRLRSRLDCALDTWRGKWAPLLVVSGGVGKEGFDEAAVMADYLAAHGVPRSAILVDSAGVDTGATAANVARIAAARHITSVIVATQYFHVARSRLAFERAGMRVAGSVHGRYFEARDVYSLAREVIGYGAYLARPNHGLVPLPGTKGTARRSPGESNS